ncbi:MAG: exo-alpha-sialidase, partial [Clostridia bacterium]|nr:exo-alpha-sialidase [Clostridia bacterium]
MQFIIPQTVDLRRENPMLRYGQPLGYGDAGAHKWCVTVLDGGKAADLAGTKATCYFTRAANTAELEQGALIVTVPMEIVTVGNPVEIEFEKACYAGVGRCVAEIRLTKDGRTTTLARMAAELARYTSDSISDPEHLLPSIDELLAQQKAMIAATEAGQAAASAANTAAAKANTAATKANTAAAAAEGWDKATVTTETLEAGMDADVTLNTAEGGAKVLEFSIPRGNPGVQVGPDEPTDPTVQVWIDTNGEPDDLSGLISDERIQTAVDSYLDKSGVASGATAEQAAQIAKNTEAIEDLKANGVGTPGKDGRGIVSMTSDAVLGTPVNVVYTDGTGEVFYVRSGTSGRDGVSPTIQIVDIEGGHMVRITGEEGMKFFEVMDGTNYVLTDEDKREIAGMVESAGIGLPTPRMSNIIKAGTIFEKPEGLPYCGWPFGNVQYDADINSVVFLINAAEEHGSNETAHLYMGVMSLDTYDVTIKEIGNPDTSGHGYYTMGFCINANGEYLYVDAQSATLGRSTDKGTMWTETDVSAYSTWPESLTQLSNGRYLLWDDDSTKGVWYSDDDCATWTQAAMTGAKYEGSFLELPDGVVMCFMRKSTQGTDNGAWNGTKVKEPIVISISEDYGATWSAAADSTTLLEGCANIATAFYHADDDLVEVFTSPRYPYGDTYGAVFQYIATREDALGDRFGEPKAVLYSTAHAYQDFGHIGGCKDGNGDMHLMYYDGDGEAEGSVNYRYLKGSRNQAVLPVTKNDNASLFLPYSGNHVDAQIAKLRAELMKKINELILSGGGSVDDESFYVTDMLKYDFDFTNADKMDAAAGTITDTFGNTATATFTDGVPTVVTLADFAGMLTDLSQFSFELCV